MNFNQARENLVEGQIHAWEVLDPRILALCRELPREDFVPPGYARLALAETPIPLGHGQQTMIPGVEARMLQALEIQPQDRILEIGTGCGYVTALLARLGQSVSSVDLYPDFIERARELLERHGLAARVELLSGDVLDSWPVHEPVDVIVVTGSLPELRRDWLEQLRPGGRMFVVLGNAPVMQATLVRKAEACRLEPLFETSLPPLVGAEARREFQF